MKIIYRIALIFAFLFILIVIIGYARGYRLDIKERTVVPTGILALSSTPKAAKIYIDGVLKGVTDTNLTLPPGTYNIEIKKDGYTSWFKKITLKGEIVLSLDPLLFPTNPSLSPLTNLGIVKTITIPQTNKLLLFSKKGDTEKDGIYIFDSGRKGLSLVQSAKPILLKKNLPSTITDFENVIVSFSPDLSEAIVNFQNSSYLLSLDQENKQLFDVTNSKETLLTAWTEENNQQTLKILETFPKDIYKIATDSFKIVNFSPDETKVLYQAKENINLPIVIKPSLIGANQTDEARTLKKDNLYVYDKKEDKNFFITNNNQQINQDLPIMWYPDSKHLLIYEVFVQTNNGKAKKQISIMNYDGQNKQTIYSGPFENSFFSTTDGGNIIILANLNPENNEFPDLYQVGIK